MDTLQRGWKSARAEGESGAYPFNADDAKHDFREGSCSTTQTNVTINLVHI